MKNPLRKRLLRELKSEIGKYIAIFFFMAGIIGLVSGFLVADNSMTIAYNDSFEKYNIEDGNFELAMEAEHSLISKLEEAEVFIYENYYIEENVSGKIGGNEKNTIATKMTSDTGDDSDSSTLRIYKNRTEVDLPCVMEGKLPERSTEIAIDRMYADNNGYKVGDVLYIADQECQITGLVALSDYSALFSSNSDMMFDAIKFGVAVMTEEGFKSFGDNHLHYNYSWTYNNAPRDDIEAKEMSENFLEVINKNALIVNYVPAYINQAIHFTGNDMGSDKIMISTFLYIVIIIISFVFAVTTSNTISKEASIIGTLRASGYRRVELICHYMTMPMLVVLVAAIVGNVLGYSCLKDFFASMYYGSYSLPTFVTVWNADAFVRTTIIPMAMLFLINLLILMRKLQLSPLQFLRRDLSRKKNRKALKLNDRLKLFSRFRIRIIFQNLSNYLTLFFGVIFANFIMMFGLFFSPMLEHYSDEITSNMICDYQYLLKSQVETDMDNAEKFHAKTLKTLPWKQYAAEDISLYGIEENSAYLKLAFQGKEVYITNGYAAKYHLKVGDEIVLKESYGDQNYTFKIQGIYDYPSSMAIFMDKSAMNEIFGENIDYFNGYFSNQKLTDIDDKYIAATITKEDLTKVSRQLKVSMGDMMGLFTGFGLIMSMLIIYLLSKLIIEKNAQSISMVKILGFTDREINRLYITSTTLVFMVSLIISIPICNLILENLIVIIFADIPGWLPYYLGKMVVPEILLLSLICYLLVLLFQMNRIRKIPKSNALKNQE